MKNSLVILLVVFMIFQSTIPTFAWEVKSTSEEHQVFKVYLDENVKYDNIEDIFVNPNFIKTYGYLNEYDVAKYKVNAKEKISLDIEGYGITYKKVQLRIVND